jgi:hypothetical protein
MSSPLETTTVPTTSVDDDVSETGKVIKKQKRETGKVKKQKKVAKTETTTVPDPIDDVVREFVEKNKALKKKTWEKQKALKDAYIAKMEELGVKDCTLYEFFKPLEKYHMEDVKKLVDDGEGYFEFALKHMLPMYYLDCLQVLDKKECYGILRGLFIDHAMVFGDPFDQMMEEVFPCDDVDKFKEKSAREDFNMAKERVITQEYHFYY